MKIFNKTSISKKYKNSAVAIGNFDGIHLGHQKVLKQAKQKAKKNNLLFGLVTFEPMPVMYFNKNVKSHRINSLNQKKKTIKKLQARFFNYYKV